MKRLLLLGAVSIAMLVAPAAAFAETNTNECVTDLGGILPCQDLNVFGFPNDLHACCDGVRDLAIDRCECNPAIDVVLTEEGTQIYDLEPLCRLIQPFDWFFVPLRALRSCTPLQTHDYGCAMNDMEMDGARLGSVFAFSELFDDAANEAICLDTPAFVSGLGTVFESDIDLTVAYGVGTYSGLEDVAEYLGMAFAGLNHGYWLYDLTIDPTKPAKLEVSSDGSTWEQGTTFQGSFLRGDMPYSDIYVEQTVAFEGCETKASTYDVEPTEGLRDWVEIFVQTSDLSQRYGVEDICRYHTEFCAGDPATEQYASEQDCIDYIGSLPLYTNACGQNRPLAGHSLPCKFKHHFMIPTNPELHCPHIGMLGSHDPNHAFKCDDLYECDEDQGQASWPPVTEIGMNTPMSVVDIFDDNNVGYETEPLGCGIPTN
jgi:hypothetical protein